jgi:hypothetical protein
MIKNAITILVKTLHLLHQIDQNLILGWLSVNNAVTAAVGNKAHAIVAWIIRLVLDCVPAFLIVERSQIQIGTFILKADLCLFVFLKRKNLVALSLEWNDY